MKKLAMLLFCIFIFGGCVSNKNFRQVKFGEGGGVVGSRTEYIINSKGELYKKNSLKAEIQKTGKISNDKIKEIIQKSETICKLDTIFNPGNYYYFVEIEMKSCKKNFVWSTSSSTNISNLTEFYNFLNTNIIKQ